MIVEARRPGEAQWAASDALGEPAPAQRELGGWAAPGFEDLLHHRLPGADEPVRLQQDEARGIFEERASLRERGVGFGGSTAREQPADQVADAQVGDVDPAAFEEIADATEEAIRAGASC